MLLVLSELHRGVIVLLTRCDGKAVMNENAMCCVSLFERTFLFVFVILGRNVKLLVELQLGDYMSKWALSM